MNDLGRLDAKYRLLIVTPLYTILLLNISIGLALMGASVHLLNRGGIYGILVSAIWLLMWLYTLIIYFVRYRPLRVTDRGIASLIVGHIWRCVAWETVQRIECVRAFDAVTRQHRHRYIVVGRDACIQFNDWIDNLSVLIAAINVHIDQHHIPTFSIDRGQDTLRGLSSRLKGAELKDVQRNGVRKQILSL